MLLENDQKFMGICNLIFTHILINRIVRGLVRNKVTGAECCI